MIKSLPSIYATLHIHAVFLDDRFSKCLWIEKSIMEGQGPHIRTVEASWKKKRVLRMVFDVKSLCLQRKKYGEPGRLRQYRN
jgi:hypothetical protein